VQVVARRQRPLGVRGLQSCRNRSKISGLQPLRHSFAGPRSD
jgi:hypothetical protein